MTFFRIFTAKVSEEAKINKIAKLRKQLEEIPETKGDIAASAEMVKRLVTTLQTLEKSSQSGLELLKTVGDMVNNLMREAEKHPLICDHRSAQCINHFIAFLAALDMEKDFGLGASEQSKIAQYLNTLLIHGAIFHTILISNDLGSLSKDGPLNQLRDAITKPLFQKLSHLVDQFAEKIISLKQLQEQYNTLVQEFLNTHWATISLIPYTRLFGELADVLNFGLTDQLFVWSGRARFIEDFLGMEIGCNDAIERIQGGKSKIQSENTGYLSAFYHAFKPLFSETAQQALVTEYQTNLIALQKELRKYTEGKHDKDKKELLAKLLINLENIEQTQKDLMKYPNRKIGALFRALFSSYIEHNKLCLRKKIAPSESGNILEVAVRKFHDLMFKVNESNADHIHYNCNIFEREFPKIHSATTKLPVIPDYIAEDKSTPVELDKMLHSLTRLQEALKILENSEKVAESESKPAP